MGWIGGQELLLIFVVILLVFGPRKIPEVARGLGRGLREFKRLTTDFQREINLAESEQDSERKVEPTQKLPPHDATRAPAAEPEAKRIEAPPSGAISRNAAPHGDSSSPGGHEPSSP